MWGLSLLILMITKLLPANTVTMDVSRDMILTKVSMRPALSRIMFRQSGKKLGHLISYFSSSLLQSIQDATSINSKYKMSSRFRKIV